MSKTQVDTSDIIRPVSRLLGEDPFFIPKYQRGYRWTERQVEDLLSDINDFEITRGRQPSSWYCLQPIVVRRNGNQWNLVDGQQRLTTIKLILMYLNTRFPDEEKVNCFSLAYETRQETCGDWSRIIGDEALAKEHIDTFHIYKAYKKIQEWMQHAKATGLKICTFRENLLERCKVIWYDIGQTGLSYVSEEDVFIRLNIGKIPLTNAELIKALFLNKSNFANRTQDRSFKSHDEVRLRQIEIATQWDMMEEELSDDAFWCFINGKENTVCPRINYLFNIISGKTPSAGDDYVTFRFFSDKFTANADVRAQWEEIYSKYQILREWFKDRFYYHRIGYLLTYGAKLGALLDQYLCPKRSKSAFRTALSDEITKVIAWDGQEDLEKKEDAKIRRILLLHNVITMANHPNDDARFPFDKFHTEKWDIEHIQAIADPEKQPKEPEDRKQYLSDAAVFVSDEALKIQIDSFVSDEVRIRDNEEFGKIYGRIIAHFAKEDVESSETDSLSNLALLDYKTNRSYGNDVFPVKRRKILERDSSGQFIPVCTRYAFLKYYTRECAGDLLRWRMLDREAYITDIKVTLSAFLQKGETR